MRIDDIPGWFDFAWLYDLQLSKVNGPETFVEVGCWMGKSTAHMASEIKKHNKLVRFYAVDTWAGSDEQEHQQIVQANGGSILHLFHANMRAMGVSDYVIPLQMESTQAAKQFADGSIDFVFIDADHHYESVKADIAAWWPKVKKGGTLAGHDIEWDGVRLAVAEAFPVYKHYSSCWHVSK